MIKVALTGGIGSGKSTVASVFEALCTPVYYSDIRAKVLMNGPLRADIVRLFGQQAYLADGSLNRPHIASVVFANPAKMKLLNLTVHPAVIADFLSWCDKQQGSVVLLETALLIESRLDRIVDQVIVVTAPLELRVQRTAARDRCSEQQVRERIQTQTLDAKLLDIADYVIDTAAGDLITPKILKILREIKKLAE